VSAASAARHRHHARFPRPGLLARFLYSIPPNTVEVRKIRNEPFSSFDFAGLKDVDGPGELPGAPGAAAELLQDLPGLELGVCASSGARSWA
jgi:hypothetical protein